MPRPLVVAATIVTAMCVVHPPVLARGMHIAVETTLKTPHSYGVVGQSLLVELVRVSRGGAPPTPAGTRAPPWLHALPGGGLNVTLTAMPQYRREWPSVADLHPPDVEAVLATVPATPPGACPDVILRAFFPLHVGLPAGVPVGCNPQVYVLGTTEYLTAIPDMLAAGSPAWHRVPPSVTIMPPSQWAADGFAASGVAPDRLWQLPHGVDTSVFRPASATRRAALRASRGWGDNTAVLLNVGSMTSNKGMHEMGTAALAAAQYLRRVGSPLRVVLALKGMDALYTSESFAQQFLPSDVFDADELQVVYTGSVLPATGVAEMMQAADVYLSPYRAEGFNLPVLEAAACGLPVVCTAGGPTDAFTDASFALHVNASMQRVTFFKVYAGHMLQPDMEHLTHQVLRAVTDDVWRAGARAAAPRAVQRRHTWHRVVQRLLQRAVADLQVASAAAAVGSGQAVTASPRAQSAAAARTALWATATSGLPPLPPDYRPTVVYAGRGDVVAVSVRVGAGAGPGPDVPMQLFVSVARLVLAHAQPVDAVFRVRTMVAPHSNGTYAVHLANLPTGCYRLRAEPDGGSRWMDATVRPTDVVVLNSVPPPLDALHLAFRPLGNVTTDGRRVLWPTPVAADAAAALLLNVGAEADARMLRALAIRQHRRVAYGAGHALAAVGAVAPVMPSDPAAKLHAVQDILVAASRHDPLLHALTRADVDPLRDVPVVCDRFPPLPSPFLVYTGLDTTPAYTAAARLLVAGVPALRPTAAQATAAAHRTMHSMRCPSVRRVGFVSPALYNHSLGKALAGVVLRLAARRSVFEVFVFRMGRPDDDGRDPVVQALSAPDGPTVVTWPPDVGLARVQADVSEAGLDVLVFGDVGIEPLTYYLSFARLAPVQCAFWGSPASSASPGVDYFLAGAAFIPPHDGANAETFTEQVVQLPGLAAFLYRPQAWTDSSESVASLLHGVGLPTDTPLLFCPHTLAKLHPQFDAAVVQVLAAAPRAHVVLLQGHGPAWLPTFLGRLAATPGFDAVVSRVHVLPRLSGPEYGAVLTQATAVLDAFPYSGFTTSVEALALGVPVVTLPGGTLRSRQTAALYRVMGVPDLVCDSVPQYVDRAARLVGDAAWRARVVASIEQRAHKLFRDERVIDEWAAFLRTAVRSIEA